MRPTHMPRARSPTKTPSQTPTNGPTIMASTMRPTHMPTTNRPTKTPSETPTITPTTQVPTVIPTHMPTTISPTRTTTQVPTRTPSNMPADEPTSCSATQRTLRVEIFTDRYGSDTSWTIRDSESGQILGESSKVYGSNEIYYADICLQDGLSYNFTIRDQYSDGMVSILVTILLHSHLKRGDVLH